MTDELRGKRIAFLVAPEGVEQVELTSPWRAVTEAGATPRLVSTKNGMVQANNHLTPADSFPIDDVVSEVDAADYDALVLPGGVANPDYLRLRPPAVAFTKAFFDAGKPVAAICHASWTLIEADVVRGRQMTSFPILATDLRNAGANWVDEQVVVDASGGTTLVTSRNPGDLDAFNQELLAAFAR